MKSILRQAVASVFGMVVNALLTMLATKIVDVIYNKFIKKPLCFLCGSTGVRAKNTVNGPVVVPCDCRKKKKSWKNLFKWEIP